MLNSPHPMRRMIGAAGFAMAIVIMQASATEGAIAANEVITPPVRLDTVAQGVAISTAEMANSATSAAGKATAADAPTTGASPAAATTVAAPPAEAKSPPAAVKRTPASASSRPARRAGEFHAARGAEPVRALDDHCRGIWCGRRFVLMLGISY